MIKQLSLAVLLTTTMMGCASLKPPVRPAYTGADTVDAVQSAQLLGAWTVNQLNPYPDSEPQSTTIEYLQDGTLKGLIIPQGEAAEAMGNLRMEMTGSWALDGDTLSHSDIQVDSQSDSAVGAMIGKLMNNSTRGIEGQANIYELSANRIVMVGSDGAAMEYVRQ